MDSNRTARVLEIQRMSTEDGPGIRTTVFFKGCSLKCRWCHNPESISAQPQVHWIDSRCIGCRTCLDVCPTGSLSLTGNGIEINRSTCRGCGSCAEECPAAAMELLGKNWSVEALVKEVLKDKAYFETSGGGVTVSGGEPGLQADVIEGFLQSLRAAGVHTALDTCGMVPREALEKLLLHSSMVLYDVKALDDQEHRQFTGASNRTILDNLLYTAEYMRNHLYPSRLWIRTPLIPEMTADGVNIFQIGNFIAAHLGDVVTRWELCAFNNLCRDKYARLGRSWELADTPLLSKGALEQFVNLARASGVDPSIVAGTGSTRLENKKPVEDRVVTH